MWYRLAILGPDYSPLEERASSRLLVLNKKTNKVDETLDDILKSIPEHFNFLVVGHWLQGNFGEDRKNMGGTIKAFLETFKNRKIKPGLILKVNGGNYSIMDRDQMIAKIEEVKSMVDGDLPNIYLLQKNII